MQIERLLSLPTIAALNRLVNGHYDGTQSLGIGINRHGEVADFFGEADIEIADEPSVAKKIRATLDRINTTVAEHDSLKRLLHQIADPRYYRGRDHEASIEYLNQALRGDGFEIRLIGTVHRLVVTALNVVAASGLAEKAHALDLPSVQADFDRAVSETESDPAHALTSACATIESVCKCILEEMGKPLPSNKDIKGLVNEVAKHLNLSPGRSDFPKEWEADIKQVLSGLINVAAGIGALRTHAGDAHGKGKKSVPVDARVARLAIHAASTLSLFYIETWQRTIGKSKASI